MNNVKDFSQTKLMLNSSISKAVRVPRSLTPGSCRAGSRARRPRPCGCAPTNDAVAVLADVTVIRGRPSAIGCSRDAIHVTELSPLRTRPSLCCPLHSFLYLYTYVPRRARDVSPNVNVNPISRPSRSPPQSLAFSSFITHYGRGPGRQPHELTRHRNESQRES